MLRVPQVTAMPETLHQYTKPRNIRFVWFLFFSALVAGLLWFFLRKPEDTKQNSPATLQLEAAPIDDNIPIVESSPPEQTKQVLEPEISEIPEALENPSEPTQPSEQSSKLPVLKTPLEELEGWYRSNPLAMALESVDGPQATRTQEWVLELKSGAQEFVKTLYYQGQPRDTWQRTYRDNKPFQEQHKRYGVLLENRFFDETTGNLAEITNHSAKTGEIREKFLFFYNEKDVLIRSLMYDNNGTLIWENNFRSDSEGRLMKLKIRKYNKQYDLIQYQLQGIDSFIQTGGTIQNKYFVSLFNPQRQNTSQIVYLDNVVAKRSNFEYSANGQLQRTIVTEPKKTTQYDYNNTGALVQKQIWNNGMLSETEIYRYDALGRLIQKRYTQEEKEEYSEERFSYQGESQDINKIIFYLNDEIDKIRFYSDVYSYYEELYFDGKPVAKVYYNYYDQIYTEITSLNAPDPENFDDSTEKADIVETPISEEP